MNLTPASSSDLPSEAIFTRVSESGTRLMQTAIFTYSPQWRYTSLFQSARKQTWELDAGNHVERSVLASCDASEIGTQAHLHAARVEGGAERRPARQGEHGQRCAGVHAVVRHQRERVARLDCFAIGVARGGQPGGGLERRGGVAVVRVQPQAGGAEPLQR